VKALVYVAAFAPDKGETAGSLAESVAPGKKGQCKNDDPKEQSRRDALQTEKSVGCDIGCRDKCQ
jgi:hypothetical protein